jgi:ABC-type uncharacterized transport system permease subunit
MATSTASMAGRRVARRSRSGWITALVAAFALLVAYWLLNLIIAGQCGLTCVVSTLSQTLRLATPIAFAAFCGVMCERSGVTDIGIEGKMLMAAMVAYMANLFVYQALKDSLGTQAAGDLSRWIALGIALLSALILAWLHAVISIKFKANQIISGTFINMFALGLTGLVYRQYLAQNLPPGPGTFPIWNVPVLSQIPIVGPILFQQKPLTYLMLIVALLINFVLFSTKWGLRTLAVGEHPRAADTLGINVFRVRYIDVMVGGLIAGLGGAWFTLEAVDVFNPGMTNGLGFIGLAAMIFGKWTPFGSLLGALIFGLGTSVTATISIFRPDIPSQIPQMLPYILTIIVLTGVVGRAIPPAADGVPYEKGD